jgi:hypothetical protein
MVQAPSGEVLVFEAPDGRRPGGGEVWSARLSG